MFTSEVGSPVSREFIPLTSVADGVGVAGIVVGAGVSVGSVLVAEFLGVDELLPSIINAAAAIIIITAAIAIIIRSILLDFGFGSPAAGAVAVSGVVGAVAGVGVAAGVALAAVGASGVAAAGVACGGVGVVVSVLFSIL